MTNNYSLLTEKNSLQMLDAAHGEGVCPKIAVCRTHLLGVEEQVARVGAACGGGRGGPTLAIRADTRQGSRRVVAEARSRHAKAIAGMNTAKSAAIKNEKLKMKNYRGATNFPASRRTIHY
ncbi:MAG: hypothetical protein NC209_00950 [Alistipes sp.]|nr:hypothetical protein [Alistipes sp.]